MESHLTVAELVGGSLLADPLQGKELGNEVVGNITYDSREISGGCSELFFAIPGKNVDGHIFINEVFKKNPKAIIVSEQNLKNSYNRSLQVKDVQRSMAVIAKKFFRYSETATKLIAITGTNGKTTNAHLCRAMLERVGKTGLIGTIECDLGACSNCKSIPNTTPPAISLFKMLRTAALNSCKHLALEVSSHSLVQKRVYGLEPEVAIFTNLSLEHLDFHKTLDNYFFAKKMLFDGTNGCHPKISVINIDDSYGLKLFSILKREGKSCFSYGMSENSDFRICEVKRNALAGTEFKIRHEQRLFNFSSRLFGDHNLLNIASSFAACMAISSTPNQFIEAVAEFKSVPGRLNKIDLSNGAVAFIDYAHTPHALEVTINALRAETKGKLIVVFGCNGNFDSSKRAPMTAVVNDLAGFAIATSDDIRYEAQENIFRDMAAGVTDARKIVFIEDRREAVAHALKMSKSRDVVLIAGKGHETHQIIRGVMHDFDDAKVVRELDVLLCSQK